MSTAEDIASKVEAIDVTVVFLEMAKQPSAVVHPPLNRQLALLRAKAIPLPFYRFLMDQVGRRWHWVNRLRLSDEALASVLADARREVSVLYLDGAPAGFFELFRETPQRVDLAYFGMTDRAIGQGIGRWFLAAAVAAAWAHRPDVVTVQTCTLDHPAALPLYQKLGFSPVGRQEETVVPMTLDERAAVLGR